MLSTTDKYKQEEDVRDNSALNGFYYRTGIINLSLPLKTLELIPTLDDRIPTVSATRISSAQTFILTTEYLHLIFEHN